MIGARTADTKIVVLLYIVCMLYVSAYILGVGVPCEKVRDDRQIIC